MNECRAQLQGTRLQTRSKNIILHVAGLKDLDVDIGTEAAVWSPNCFFSVQQTAHSNCSTIEIV